MDLDRLIKEEDIIDYEVKDPELMELINYVLRKIPDEYEEDFPMFSLYQTNIVDAECAFVVPGDVDQVFFNADMLEDSSSCRKGLENEEEADALASNWGFAREVKASRRKLGSPT